MPKVSPFDKKTLLKKTYLFLALTCVLVGVSGIIQVADFVKIRIEQDYAFQAKTQFHVRGAVKVKAKITNLGKSQNKPSQIIIPEIRVNTKVTESKIIGGFWQVPDDAASHGQGTAEPGQKGNMVIFAHARKDLFATLLDVKKGDTVFVLTKSAWYKYTIIYTRTVIPSDVSVIAPSNDERLTLYTCSGHFDEKRFVATAVRDKNSS